MKIKAYLFISRLIQMLCMYLQKNWNFTKMKLKVHLFIYFQTNPGVVHVFTENKN